MISRSMSAHDYTPNYDYEKRNHPYVELIGTCKEYLMKDGIYLSVDESEIPEITNNKVLLDIMQATLEYARLLCIEATLDQDRFIRIRTRNLQNKTFIKIQYSSSNHTNPQYDPLEKNISRKVEYASGYFKHQLDKEIGTIKIALPISRT